jgi:ABC-type transport system involved in multi-copper enzyme maturation permease subunit
VIRRIASLAGAVFADAVRRRVVVVVVFFAAVLALAIPSLPSYGLGVVQGVYREVALALTFVGALVLTLALSANRIPGEIERRTIYSVVARPVGRWEYLVGTWIGVMGVMAAVVAAFTVVEQVLGLLNYGDPMWLLWQGALAIWMEMGVLAALCVAISAISGPVVVVVAALAFLFVGHSRESVLGADSSGLARVLYPSLDTFNIINPVAHGTGVDAAYVLGMALAFAGWCGLLLLLGSLTFTRRDL